MKMTLEDAGISSGNGVIRLLYKYDPSSLKDMIVKIDESKTRNSFTNTVALPTPAPVVKNIENSGQSQPKLEEKISTPPNNSTIETVDKSNDENEMDSSSQMDRVIKVFKPIPDNHMMPKCN